jgi:hypothetical protein
MWLHRHARHMYAFVLCRMDVRFGMRQRLSR